MGAADGVTPVSRGGGAGLGVVEGFGGPGIAEGLRRESVVETVNMSPKGDVGSCLGGTRGPSGYEADARSCTFSVNATYPGLMVVAICTGRKRVWLRVWV